MDIPSYQELNRVYESEILEYLAHSKSTNNFVILDPEKIGNTDAAYIYYIAQEIGGYNPRLFLGCFSVITSTSYGSLVSMIGPKTIYQASLEKPPNLIRFPEIYEIFSELYEII